MDETPEALLVRLAVALSRRLPSRRDAPLDPHQAGREEAKGQLVAPEGHAAHSCFAALQHLRQMRAQKEAALPACGDPKLRRGNHWEMDKGRVQVPALPVPAQKPGVQLQGPTSAFAGGSQGALAGV